MQQHTNTPAMLRKFEKERTDANTQHYALKAYTLK